MLGYKPQFVRESLLNNKHTSATAAYKILLNMYKQGKKLPDAAKLRKMQNLSDGNVETLNNSADISNTLKKFNRNSVSPNYRPLTSYGLPASLLPASIGNL